MVSHSPRATARAQDNLDARWASVESCLKRSSSRGEVPNVGQHVDVLCANGMAVVIKRWFIIHAEGLIEQIFDDFYKKTTDIDRLLMQLRRAGSKIVRLLNVADWLEEQCESDVPMEEEMDEENRPRPVTMRSEILACCSRLSTSKITADFDSLIMELFKKSFKAFDRVRGSDNMPELVLCPACDAFIADDDNQCFCSKIVEDFIEINKVIDRVKFFPSLVHDCVQSVCFDLIRKRVIEICQIDFENKWSHQLRLWLDETVGSWLQTISGYSPSVAATFKEDLLFFLYDILIDYRAGQLFDMIVDFPDSLPALEDLRDSIQKVKSLDKLVTKLRCAMERRLFHPGVKTADILTAYVSTIKALRILDPSGFILQSVCEPLTAYLKSRENIDNTVRIIVASLTDENNIELKAELAKCNQKTVTDNYASSDEEDSDWQKWVPQAKVSRMIKASDIITLLVNIYGSKEHFLQEYDSLLSDRLLNGTSDTQREIMYVELLKIRLGEVTMNNCEVMLNDVKYSKRLHSQIIQEKLSKTLNTPLEALIISSQFWPEVKEETITIPEEITRDFDLFRKEYEVLNGNRTVILRPYLGWVELSLEIDGSEKNIRCTPAQASLIKLFDDRDCWKNSELVSALECSRIIVKRLVAFWSQQGILKDHSDGESIVVVGSAADDGTEAVSILDNDAEMDELEEDERTKTDQALEARYQIYWGFVRGLLTNLKQAPLDRIFAMLGMFVSSGSQEFTLQDCKLFLDSKVKDGQVLYEAGVYTMPK